MILGNVLKKYIVGITLFSLFVLTGTVQAFENFEEIQDSGVLNNVYAMRAFQVHYTNFMFYTMNVQTPGFIEEGVYNSRRADSKKVDNVMFYRWRAGPIMETGRELDFYIDARSRGFFVVKMQSTFAYTRDGRFQIDSRGRLVTLAGQYPVMGDSGEIIIPEGYQSITCSRSGTLYVDGQRLAQLKTAVFKSFKDMRTMDTLNGNYFVLTRELELLEGPEHYAIVQGSLEQNNVLKGITGDILMAKNSYDVNAKSAHLINKTIGTAASLISPSP